MTSTLFIPVRWAMPWLLCVHLCGAPEGTAMAPLAWSSSDHWTRQGRAAPWLPQPAQEHAPGASAALCPGTFGWA